MVRGARTLRVGRLAITLHPKASNVRPVDDVETLRQRIGRLSYVLRRAHWIMRKHGLADAIPREDWLIGWLGPDGWREFEAGGIIAAELDFKYNTRKATDGARTSQAIGRIEGKRLIYRAKAST